MAPGSMRDVSFPLRGLAPRPHLAGPTRTPNRTAFGGITDTPLGADGIAQPPAAELPDPVPDNLTPTAGNLTSASDAGGYASVMGDRPLAPAPAPMTSDALQAAPPGIAQQAGAAPRTPAVQPGEMPAGQQAGAEDAVYNERFRSLFNSRLRDYIEAHPSGHISDEAMAQYLKMAHDDTAQQVGGKVAGVQAKTGAAVASANLNQTKANEVAPNAVATRGVQGARAGLLNNQAVEVAPNAASSRGVQAARAGLLTNQSNEVAPNAAARRGVENANAGLATAKTGEVAPEAQSKRDRRTAQTTEGQERGRHNQVTEGQGAARIGQGDQKVALSGWRAKLAALKEKHRVGEVGARLAVQTRGLADRERSQKFQMEGAKGFSADPTLGERVMGTSPQVADRRELVGSFHPGEGLPQAPGADEAPPLPTLSPQAEKLQPLPAETPGSNGAPPPHLTDQAKETVLDFLTSPAAQAPQNAEKRRRAIQYMTKHSTPDELHTLQKAKVLG